MIKIKRVSVYNGVSRYRVSLSNGLPVEFLITVKPKPVTREWQLLFAQTVSQALERWRRLNSEWYVS